MRMYLEHVLSSGWRLRMHPRYELFSRENEYAIFDEDGDLMMRFKLTFDEFEVTNCSGWSMHYKVSANNHLISIFNEPDEE